MIVYIMVESKYDFKLHYSKKVIFLYKSFFQRGEYIDDNMDKKKDGLMMKHIKI